MKTKFIFLLALLGTSICFGSSNAKLVTAKEIVGMVNQAPENNKLKCPLKAEIIDGQLILSKSDSPAIKVPFAVNEQFFLADAYPLGSQAGDVWSDVADDSKSIVYENNYVPGPMKGMRLFINFAPNGQINEANIMGENSNYEVHSMICHPSYN